MTKSEAISEWTFRSNHIKKWLDEYGEEPSIRHYVELIDMAIESLSAEPCKSTDQNVADVPSGDLISRQEAIEVGNKIVEELALSSLDWDALKYWAKELFDALPSADRPQVNSTEWVEEKEKEFEELHRPKGEWIVENHEVVCSVCGQNNLETNFCPCCGADMRGDK